MSTTSELLTVVGAGTSVVAITVAATLYMGAGGSEQFDPFSEQASDEGRQSFELGDAFFPCRDHIPVAIPYKVRNINIDSHSSRYDPKDNSHVVFIDLEVMDRPGAFYSSYSHTSNIICRVSATNNQITSFKVRKG